jgi:hypothetical protein
MATPLDGVNRNWKKIYAAREKQTYASEMHLAACEVKTREAPDFMRDPSLLPKKPPQAR